MYKYYLHTLSVHRYILFYSISLWCLGHEMARAVLKTRSLNTECLHTHRRSARTPTPHRALCCGLTWQGLNLQQNPRFCEETLTHHTVNSFILKKKKKKFLSLFTVIWGQKLDSSSFWICDSSKTISKSGAVWSHLLSSSYFKWGVMYRDRQPDRGLKEPCRLVLILSGLCSSIARGAARRGRTRRFLERFIILFLFL